MRSLLERVGRSSAAVPSLLLLGLLVGCRSSDAGAELEPAPPAPPSEVPTWTEAEREAAATIDEANADEVYEELEASIHADLEALDDSR